MVENNPSTNEINTYFLINEVFSGDGIKALKTARKYPQVKVTLTPKSIERYLILENIDKGISDDEIINYLAIDGYKVNKNRIKRLRKELEDGKRQF